MVVFRGARARVARRPRPQHAGRLQAILVLVVVFAASAVVLDAAPASAAVVTFTVNSTADASDANAGNGTCATAGAVCTLRAAMQEVNAGSAANSYVIAFSVAGTTQVGSTDLPSLNRTVTIDGSTAPGYAVATGPTFTVRCASQDSAVSAYGLGFLAADSTLRGLRLVNCSTAVITSTGATNLHVVGNQIGSDGSAFSASNAVKVGVSLNGTGSVVGGPTAGDRNVISGEQYIGVVVTASATNSTVQGNRLGTDAAGAAGITNPSGTGGSPASTSAAAIQTQASGTTVTGNLISGNPGIGVSILSGSATVEGNLIGTNAAGTAGIGNGSSGLAVWPGASASVGGAGAGEGNVVAYYLPPVSYLTAPLVQITGATVTLLGNTIGSNAAGTAPLCASTKADSTVALSIVPSDAGVGASVTVGGSAAGAGNLIAGCGTNVSVRRAAGQTSGASTVTLKGNRIGTNAAGSAAMASFPGADQNQAGVTVEVDQKVTIGGSAAGEGNVISGNGVGVHVDDNEAGVTIRGNRIGTNAAGTAAVPNARDGIDVVASGTVGASPIPTVIGGPGTAGNVISGNGADGMLVARPATVQGNLVGTDAAGTAAIPNGGLYGVLLNNEDIVFGGTGAGEGNTVSGNSHVGLSVAAGSPLPAIYGNRIGTNAAGTAAVPNATFGVYLVSGATGSFGGTGAGQANTVAFNGSDGMYLLGTSAVDVRGNVIHGNDGLNIDLYQHGDPENVGNHDQIHPTITSAVVGASTTSVGGTVTSDRTGTIVVDVYAGSGCQAAYGDGEAEQYLGSISVPYPTAGAATAFNGTVAKATVGPVITATSTIAGNGTSQLSTCSTYSDIQMSAKDAYAQAPVGTDVATEITVKNAGPNPATGVGIALRIGGGPTYAVDATTVDAPSVGTVDPNTDVWTIPSLASGAAATLCVRGELARSSYPLEVAPGVTIDIPVSWAPDSFLKAAAGVVDPYIGNNRAYGNTTVASPAVAGASVCALPTLSIDDVSVTRPASGTAPMTFTVHLSKVQGRDVTVHWATANGKAVAVEDYVAASGDLTFTPGQTSKTITVQAVGNRSDEPDKAFTVTLSAPKHATLADATATGTVQANHLLQGCPPGSTGNQRFVCHLYFDALGRAPETGGFTYWVKKLDTGTPRATMARSYLTQPEALRKVADRAYVLYLGRHGTNTELTNWANKLKAKTVSTQDIRISVLASATYYARTGGTRDAYVRQMFKDVFRRNVDSSGLAYWTGQLAAGKSRTNVATRFMAEPEGKRKIVGDIYLRFLRRDPTTAEANGWVTKLASGKTEVDVGIGLVASTEYYARPQS